MSHPNRVAVFFAYVAGFFLAGAVVFGLVALAQWLGWV
jgi:hypothetical protein